MADDLEASLGLDLDEAFGAVDDLGARIDSTLADAQASIEAALATLAEPVEMQLDFGLEDLPAEIESTVASVEPETGQLILPGIEDVQGDIEGAVAAADMTTDPLEVPGLEDVTAGIDELSTSVSGLGDASGGAASPMDALGLASAGVGAAAAGATGSAAGLSGVLGQINPAAAGAAGAILGGVGAFKLLTSEAISSESATMRFNDALGDMAGRVERINVGGLNTTLSDLALTLGSDDDSLRVVAAKLFELQTNAGMARDQAATFTEQMVALGARVAATRPEMGTLDQVTGSLERAFFRGGRFAARFGMDLNAAEISARAMAMTQKDTTAELSYADKVAAGASIAFEKYGNNLDTIVARGAENATIKQRSLKQAFSETMEDMGRPLVAPLFQVMEAAQPVVEALGRVLQELALGVLPALEAALVILTPPLELLADLIGAVPQPVFDAVAAFAALHYTLGPLEGMGRALIGWVTNLFSPMKDAGVAAETSGDQMALFGTQSEEAGTKAATSGRNISGGLALAAGGALLAAQSFDEMGESMSGTLEGMAGFTMAGAGIGMMFGNPALGAGIGAVTGGIVALGKSMLDSGESAAEFTQRIEDMASEIDGLGPRLAASKVYVDAWKQSFSFNGPDQHFDLFKEIAKDLEKLASIDPAGAERALQGFKDIGPGLGLTNKELKSLAQVVEDGTEKFGRHAARTKEVADRNAELKAKAEESAAAVKDMGPAADAADAALGIVRSSIDQTIANFAKFDVKPTMDDFINDLNNAAEAQANWSTTIQTLMSQGLTGLAGLVSQMSPEVFADYYGELKNADAETLARWNDALVTTGGKLVEIEGSTTTGATAVKNAWANGIAPLPTDTTGTLDKTKKAIDDKKGEFEASGKGIGEALRSGAASATDGMTTTGASLASAAIDAINAARPQALSAGAALGGAAKEGLEGAANHEVGSTIGQMLVAGFTDAIGSAESITLAARAAADVANSAKTAAMAALGVASPSREFHRIGMWATEGLALGILGGESEVVHAADQVARAARDAVARVPPLPSTVSVSGEWGSAMVAAQPKIDAYFAAFNASLSAAQAAQNSATVAAAGKTTADNFARYRESVGLAPLVGTMVIHGNDDPIVTADVVQRRLGMAVRRK